MTEHREDSVTLELSGDEALVLFEWLSNRVTEDSFEDFDDQAEQRALWDLQAELERHMVAPFRDDYDLVLSEARRRVRDPAPRWIP
jgi:hypothetical protein